MSASTHRCIIRGDTARDVITVTEERERGDKRENMREMEGGGGGGGGGLPVAHILDSENLFQLLQQGEREQVGEKIRATEGKRHNVNLLLLSGIVIKTCQL